MRLEKNSEKCVQTNAVWYPKNDTRIHEECQTYFENKQTNIYGIDLFQKRRLSRSFVRNRHLELSISSHEILSESLKYLECLIRMFSGDWGLFGTTRIIPLKNVLFLLLSDPLRLKQKSSKDSWNTLTYFPRIALCSWKIVVPLSSNLQDFSHKL